MLLSDGPFDPMFWILAVAFGAIIVAAMIAIGRLGAAIDPRPGRFADDDALWLPAIIAPLPPDDTDHAAAAAILRRLARLSMSKRRVIHFQAEEIRVLHRMVRLRKAETLAWLIDRTGHADLTAIAARRTLLPKIRNFELKHRNGDYLRPGSRA